MIVPSDTARVGMFIAVSWDGPVHFRAQLHFIILAC